MGKMDSSAFRSPAHLPYYRMAGYVVTILMHSINGYVMLSGFRGDVMKDPKIQQFATFQDKFITCWTFVAQSIHAGLGLSCDLLTVLIGDQQEHKFLKYYQPNLRLTTLRLIILYSASGGPSPAHLPYYRMAGYVVTILMHSINGYVMLSGFRGDVMKDPKIQQFATFQDKFITCWTFVAQSIHAGLGLSCDLLTVLIGDQQEHKFLKYMKQTRDILFASIVVPYSFMISTCFWPIFLYDRELILPVFTTKIVGTISNHVMHTAIVPVTLWELMFQPRETPSSHKLNFTLTTSLTAFYLAVTFLAFFEKGVFPYPLMTMTYGSVYFLVFLVLIIMWLPIYYFGQWHVSNLLWRTENWSVKKVC